VSLTTGRGPLSGDPAGRFNTAVPAGLVYVEPFPRRVRARRATVTVVDSERAVLVHRRGAPPTFAFPLDDVTGVRSEPEPEAPGRVRVAWDSVDAWYEEDEEVFGHPRNPYHRVDCVRTTRRLRVVCRGITLVDTRDTVGVYETSLAPRLYVHPRHLRTDVLVRSATSTYCPYKGTASYWSASVDGGPVVDVAWSYEDPHPECRAIAGHLCFDEARLEVEAELPRRDEETA
jgi:uncharacterized protein (DUF427 family)